MNRCIRAFWVLMFCAAIGACTKTTSSHWVSVKKPPILEKIEATDASVPPSTPWKTRPAGEVSPGNLVSIRSSDPKLKGEYRIEFDNTLKLPYKVRVTTAALTEGQLQDAVRSAYRTYFKNPSEIKVSVTKKDYLVGVQGLVEKPGEYVVKEDSSLDELIAQAGGLKESAGRGSAAQYARISGPSGTGLIKLADYYTGSKELAPRWQGGETVFFQSEGGAVAVNTNFKRNSVHILGEVNTPSEYVVEPNADFFTYLVKAGGPTDRADPGNITLIRSEGDETKALVFNMHDTGNIPQILPGDAVILNADNATPLEKQSRVGANFANILSALGIVVIAAL